MQVVLLTIFIVFSVHADMYFHGPRGANNRLDEANRERNNANRLYNTQNNDRGGYNVGKMNYYEGEEIPMKITVQHGCNNPDTDDCDIVVQMACDPLMRDGTTTTTIPENSANCRNFDCDLDVKYGRHESYAYYETCKTTARNANLFTASQKLKGNTAKFTRQQPQGTRFGYECPEERDHYPYWRPSPWRDLLIFTNKASRCAAYQAESENVKGRWYCDVPTEILENTNLNNNPIPITEEECVEWTLEDEETGEVTAQAEWVQAPSHGWPAPDCVEGEASRPNHLGLIGHKKQWTHALNMPRFLGEDEEAATCVMRIRYNITNDIRGWDQDDESLGSPLTAEFNTPNPGNNAANKVSLLPIWEKYGVTQEEIQACLDTNNRNDQEREENCREYVWVDNPKVDPLGVVVEGNNNKFRLKLQLAINTAQYPRTFQDRSHTFQVKKRGANIPDDARIALLTVGGKRGNIVQTFPGTEYFFYPEVSNFRVGEDWIHVEYTGSNTNPNNNDGQGKQGTDRSNIVALQRANYDGAETTENVDSSGEINEGTLRGNYPAYIRQPELYELPTVRSESCGKAARDNNVAPPLLGLSDDIVLQMALGRQLHDEALDQGNMEELDDASASFSLLPQKVEAGGCWSVVSTRNNNFSNRSQKATMCGNDGDTFEQDVGRGGRTFQTRNGWLRFHQGTLAKIEAVRYVSHPKDETSASEVQQIEPVELAFEEGQTAELAVAYDGTTFNSPRLLHRTSEDGEWEEQDDVEYRDEDGQTMAVTNIDEGGWYKVEEEVNVGAIVAIVLVGLAFFCAVGFMCFWHHSHSKDEE